LQVLVLVLVGWRWPAGEPAPIHKVVIRIGLDGQVVVYGSVRRAAPARRRRVRSAATRRRTAG